MGASEASRVIVDVAVAVGKRLVKELTGEGVEAVKDVVMPSETRPTRLVQRLRRREKMPEASDCAPDPTTQHRSSCGGPFVSMAALQVSSSTSLSLRCALKGLGADGHSVMVQREMDSPLDLLRSSR